MLTLKQPAEIVDVDLWTGTPINTIATSTVPRGLIAGAAPIGAVATVPGADGATGAAVRISGGTDGERYLVTQRGTLANGEVIEAEIEVVVIDGTWAMPDGGVGYITIADFVDYYGLEEAIALTDPAGTGRIDKAILVSALRAAQGIADVNLAAIYAVPLTVVPDIVKTAIADLARARLYPRGAPDGVSGAAKDAQRMLERIAAGAGPLPIPAGAQTPVAASTDPVVIRPGRQRIGCRWGDL